LEAGSYIIVEHLSMLKLVPILSQLGGRELLPVAGFLPVLGLFQSSPSLEAGSYDRNDDYVRSITVFQSSPSLEAGSYKLAPPDRVECVAVPILSQLGGRELP